MFYNNGHGLELAHFFVALLIPSNLSYKTHLVDNKIVEDSDVVRVPPVGAAPTASSFSTYGLGKDNCKTRREPVKF